MKHHSSQGARASATASSWQLEEAQVFWAKGEQGLALGLLRKMIHSLEGKVRHTQLKNKALKLASKSVIIYLNF